MFGWNGPSRLDRDLRTATLQLPMADDPDTYATPPPDETTQNTQAVLTDRLSLGSIGPSC